MNEEYITIQKKYIGQIEAYAGTLEALARLHGVEDRISTLSAENIEARDMGDEGWPEAAKVGEIWAETSKSPDGWAKFENIDEARKTLLNDELSRDAVFYFFGTEEDARSFLDSGAAESSKAIMRKGLEIVEPNGAW